jgi:hypothetical protein
MEISITSKGILGVLVAFTLGLGYLSISYFSVSELMGYLFSGLTVLVFLLLLSHINTLMNKQRKQRKYTPLNGYDPRPEVPYEPQSQLSEPPYHLQDQLLQQYPRYQDQLIKDQTIGDNSSNNSQYVIKDSNVTIVNSDKKKDEPKP